MIVFKILLIILVSAPVIGVAWILYGQVLSFIRQKNLTENRRRRG